MAPPTLKRDQIRYLQVRPEARGSEIRANPHSEEPVRPAMVLSDYKQHELELFVTAFSTSAATGRANSRALLEEYDTRPARVRGHIDVQQLWTFPTSRDRSYHSTLPVVRNADVVRSRVKSYLAKSRLAAGNVVWVALRASDRAPVFRTRNVTSAVTRSISWFSPSLFPKYFLFHVMEVSWWHPQRAVYCISVIDYIRSLLYCLFFIA